jgi:diguanylate cyclase (GGDEF)-like protein
MSLEWIGAALPNAGRGARTNPPEGHALVAYRSLGDTLRQSRTPGRFRRMNCSLRTIQLLALGLAALLPAMACALDPERQASQYVTRIWSTADGLPDPAVRTVIQSRDGYLWLGTHAGLVRFDGRRFVVYDRDNAGLGHDQVLALAEDPAGRIWIGTEQGLYRLAGGRIEAIDRFRDQRINVLEVAPDGSIWIGASAGLHRSDGARVTRFDASVGLDAALILAITLTGEQLLVGTDRGAWRKVGERFEPIPGLPQDFTRSILVTRNGSTWFATRDMLVERVADRIVRQIPSPLEQRQIWHMLEDRQGNVWLASYGAGIQRIEADGYDTIPLGEGYANRRPWRLLEDREGNLWVGTREGLVRLRDGPAISWSVEEGLAAAHARAVFEDTDGSLWVGHVAGVSRVAGREVRNFGPADGLPGENQSTILRDRHGVLWVGGAGGLSRFDGERFHALTRADGLPNDFVKVAIESRDGRIWTGHFGGIGWVEDGRASAPVGFEALETTSIEVLHEDRLGTIWIGTLEHGFWRWRDGVLEAVPLTDEAAPLGVRTIHEDALGRLWVGTTARGIRVLDSRTIRSLGRDQGFPAHGVWSILDDGRGSMWFSSDIGLWQFATNDLVAVLEGRSDHVAPLRRLTERDGMKSREANGGGMPSGFVARDGRPWFATAGGAVVVDLESRFNQPSLVAVRIESVRADGTTLEVADDSSPARTRARSLDFDWTAVHFANPDAIRFRYRLVGQDASWLDGRDRRSAQYTNLPPGDYRFEVEARLDDLSRWQPGEPVEFRIEPFWHERVLVRTGMALLLLGLVGMALRARFTAQTRLAARLRQEVDSRTTDLRRANAELAKLASVDSLTGLATSRVLREWLAALCRPDSRADRVALLLIDVDDFKPYNDTYGHPAGDECLRRVAALLEPVAASRDGLAARYGGEEFALILPEVAPDLAVAIAETIRISVEALAIPAGHGARHPVVTISIGVAAASPRTTDDASLLVSADQALYRAKHGGRNRVETTGAAVP